MRLFQYLVIFCLGFSLILSCDEATNQQSPEDAAKGFFLALSELDFELARSYGTETTSDALKLIEVEINMAGSDEAKEARRKEFKKQFSLDFQKVDCTTADGQTNCTVCCDSSGGVAPVDMVEKDDKWFVNLEL